MEIEIRKDVLEYVADIQDELDFLSRLSKSATEDQSRDDE